MASVYLETSFVSACVTDRTDAASVYRRQTSLEWWNTQSGRHEVFVSAEVTAELSDPAFRRRDEAIAFIRGVSELALNEETAGLAVLFVREMVMPGPVAGDAIHVAACCAHGIEYMLSWNVRHLANPNKMMHLRAVCRRAGVIPPAIVTPDLLWEAP